MNPEMCVSASALSIQSEGGSTAPDVGDEVEFTVSGKVTRSEGGNVYVTPSTINGQPAGEGGEMGDDPMDAEMEQMINQRDNPTAI